MLKGKGTIDFPHEAKKKMDRAISLFEANNYRAALPIFESLVEEGYLAALSFIANIYEIGGHEIDKDPEKAYLYYQRAADYGDTEGYLGLGRLLFYGEGVEKDYEESFRCYSQLENVGYAPAIVNLMLGRFFETGRAVEKDINKARNYYREAIKQGNVIALNSLSRVEISQGNYLRGAILRIISVLKFLVLRLRNPKDIRLKSA